MATSMAVSTMIENCINHIWCLGSIHSSKKQLDKARNSRSQNLKKDLTLPPSLTTILATVGHSLTHEKELLQNYCHELRDGTYGFKFRRL